MTSALVFDADGTLFDVHSMLARCEAFRPEGIVKGLDEILS